MKAHQHAVLTALGALHPPQGTPQVVSPHRDPQTGRFAPPPGFTLNGGYHAPPPPPPGDPVAEHNRFLAELIGPTDLGA
jgi:hypothetical protein